MKQTTLLEERTDVRGLRSGDHFSGILRVVEASVMTTKRGSPYIRARLGDKTGTIAAKHWKSGDLKPFDGFIRIEAVAEEYQGEVELKIIDAAAVEPSKVRLADFLPTVEGDRDEMVREFMDFAANLEKPGLADYMVGVFDEDVLGRFKMAPAATKNHHAAVGGLLLHSLEMTRAAIKFEAPQRFGVDEELLIAGALVHDIGKIEEYGVETGFQRTTSGMLLGHIVQGIMILEASAPDPRPEWMDRLLHMVASHHGRLEWGSPVRPATPEAMLLHELDMIDSRLQAVAEALGQSNGEGEWTGWVSMLDTKVLRPSGGEDQ